MISFSDRDQKILSAIGRSPRGEQFVDVLERVMRESCSIDSIPDGIQDYGAQVEGRKLLKSAFRTLIDGLRSKERVNKKADEEDQYE